MSAPAGGGVRPTDASVRAVLATPGAPAMALWSVVARFGLGMLNLSVLFFVSSETGSYSVAGALSAASLVGAAAGTVAQGRWIDRFGPTRPLLALVVPHALLGAAVVAAIAASVPTVVVAAVIVAQSAALPAVAVASRAMWPHLVPAGRAREAAYSYEAVSFELCWLLGPVAASLLATVFWPGTALVVALTLATVGAVGFSLTGVVRARRGATAAPPRSIAAPPGRVGDRESTGQPRSNGLATLLAAASGFGLGIGFVVVGLTAGTAANDVAALAGVLLAGWSISSVLGGLGYQRRPWPTAVASRLPVLLALFAVLLLIPAALGGIIALSAAVVAAGATLVAQVSTHNVLLDRVVAPQRLAEAYGWLTTTIALANGAGQAIGGLVVQHSGYRASFLTAGVCVLGFAALVFARRSRLSEGGRNR